MSVTFGRSGGLPATCLPLLDWHPHATAATVAANALALLRPARMTDGRAAWRLQRISPGDLRLHYSELSFSVRDDFSGRPLKLAAWWIPHPRQPPRCVILLHGYGDAKIGAIAWAP